MQFSPTLHHARHRYRYSLNVINYWFTQNCKWEERDGNPIQSYWLRYQVSFSFMSLYSLVFVSVPIFRFSYSNSINFGCYSCRFLVSDFFIQNELISPSIVGFFVQFPQKRQMETWETFISFWCVERSMGEIRCLHWVLTYESSRSPSQHLKDGCGIQSKSC